MNHNDETGHVGCKNEPFLTMRHVTSGGKLNHNDDIGQAGAKMNHNDETGHSGCKNEHNGFQDRSGRV